MPLIKILLNRNVSISTWSFLRHSVHVTCKRYMNQSYYDVLKVPESCSSKDVRDAFISLSKKSHPDKHFNDPTMHERFIRIREAYTVLINPLTRKAYDISLNHKRKFGELPIKTSVNSYYQHRTAENQKKTQSSSSNSSSSGNNSTHTSSKSEYSSGFAEGEQFTWHYGTAENYYKNTNTANAKPADEYYGIKGIKKVSNRKVAFVVLLFAFFAVVIQLMIIRNNARRSKEISLERTRKYALILEMAKEKVRLYGNDYQIELLKKSLNGSFGDKGDIELLQDEGNLDRKGIDIVDEKITYQINKEQPPKIPTPSKSVNIIDTIPSTTELQSSTNNSCTHNTELFSLATSKSYPNKNPTNTPIISGGSPTNPTIPSFNNTIQLDDQLRPVVTSNESGTESCEKCKKCKRV